MSENQGNDLCRSLIGVAISAMRRILSAGLRGLTDVIPEIFEIMIIEIGLAENSLDQLAPGIDSDLDGAVRSLGVELECGFLHYCNIGQHASQTSGRPTMDLSAHESHQICRNVQHRTLRRLFTT
jgi:hypothetical protein